MKYQVKMVSTRGTGKHAPAHISVKFREGEAVYFDQAIDRAVKTNLGKNHTVNLHGPIALGVEVRATVSDRYGRDYPYLVTLTEA